MSILSIHNAGPSAPMPLYYHIVISVEGAPLLITLLTSGVNSALRTLKASRSASGYCAIPKLTLAQVL